MTARKLKQRERLLEQQVQNYRVRLFNKEAELARVKKQIRGPGPDL